MSGSRCCAHRAVLLRPCEPALPLLHRCIYNRSGEWMDETLPVLLSTAVAFSYVTFLTVLSGLRV